MNLYIRKRATVSMQKVAGWIDEQNTHGAGDRWLEQSIEELKEFAKSQVLLSICKDPNLAKFGYRCFTHRNKWVVAYKINGNKFVIYRFLYGPFLSHQSKL